MGGSRSSRPAEASEILEHIPAYTCSQLKRGQRVVCDAYGLHAFSSALRCVLADLAQQAAAPQLRSFDSKQRLDMSFESIRRPRKVLQHQTTLAVPRAGFAVRLGRRW